MHAGLRSRLGGGEGRRADGCRGSRTGASCASQAAEVLRYHRRRGGLRTPPPGVRRQKPAGLRGCFGSSGGRPAEAAEVRRPVPSVCAQGNGGASAPTAPAADHGAPPEGAAVHVLGSAAASAAVEAGCRGPPESDDRRDTESPRPSRASARRKSRADRNRAARRSDSGRMPTRPLTQSTGSQSRCRSPQASAVDHRPLPEASASHASGARRALPVCCRGHASCRWLLGDTCDASASMARRVGTASAPASFGSAACSDRRRPTAASPFIVEPARLRSDREAGRTREPQAQCVRARQAAATGCRRCPAEATGFARIALEGRSV